MNGADATLSLCMIMRNNASTLAAALNSIRPWVDEMIVVDTGSEDDSQQIARELGARVFEFPWCDDFSAARNVSLSHATGKWLFWMDTDDTIDADNGRQLREIAHASHPDSTLGFSIKVRCPGVYDRGIQDYTEVDHVKLFRNHPDLRFEFRIHEQLLPSIRRQGGEVVWTDLFVTHSGSDPSPRARRQKCERDLRILSKELDERPNHTFALFNVGMTMADLEKYGVAIEYLEASIEAAVPSETHLRKAYALLASCWDQIGDYEKASKVCSQGLLLVPDDCELRFRKAKALHDLQELEHSAQIYLELLAHQDKPQFASMDPSISGYKARHNLAIVYQDMGRDDLAEPQWRSIVRERPNHEIAWISLGQTLLRQNRYAAVEVLLDQMNGDDILEVPRLLLKADLARQCGHHDQAYQCLIAAVRKDDNSTTREKLCQFLFEQELNDQAIVQLTHLIQSNPHDASAYQNLGLVYLRMGMLHQAEASLSQSLVIRPNSAATQDLLAQVAQARQSPERGFTIPKK